jgi:hypothetical protein
VSHSHNNKHFTGKKKKDKSNKRKGSRKMRKTNKKIHVNKYKEND